MATAPKRHTAQPKRNHREKYHRIPSSQRGYDWAFYKPGGPRDQAVRRDKGLCQQCLSSGVVEPYDQVDHVIPIRIQPGLRLNVSNLVCLCHKHHRQKTAADQKKYGRPTGVWTKSGNR